MDVKKVIRVNQRAVDRICDVFTELNVSSEDGEIVLLWLAGLSAGRRQQPIVGELGDMWIEPVALAWTLAAEEGDG